MRGRNRARARGGALSAGCMEPRRRQPRPPLPAARPAARSFGDVFVTRVAGNIVTNEITASLEFGTAVLGSKVLMVLGHSSCGAVAATMAGEAVPGVISSLYYA